MYVCKSVRNFRFEHMGHTELVGSFEISPCLRPEHYAFLIAFSKMRHVQRDLEKANQASDPIREAAKLPIGVGAAWFVGIEKDGDDSIVNNNIRAQGVPSLYCHWAPANNGRTLQWNGGEKFLRYISWLNYLIKHFLHPWGYVLNGTCRWQGEDQNDTGTIGITNNVLDVRTEKDWQEADNLWEFYFTRREHDMIEYGICGV